MFYGTCTQRFIISISKNIKKIFHFNSRNNNNKHVHLNLLL